MGSDKLNATSVFHPLAMNSFRHWRTLYRTSGGIDPEFAARVLLINLASPMWAPMRWLERALYSRAIAAARIEQPPVFVLGHWRTGTTHLHNLLSQDPALGFVSTFQTVAPETFFLGQNTLRHLLARVMPPTRPMDNMPLSPDLPQEEEFALCNVTEHAYYVGLYFPKRLPELFRKYVLFDGISDAELAAWSEAYITLLKKATMASGGKRLVLKNPPSTGRIPQLLKLFPSAKFIHIHRDPYRVFKSTVHLYRTSFDTIGFQKVSTAEIERNVLEFHRLLTERYLRDRELIPAENLFEMSYQDFIADELGMMQRVYESLALPGWEAAAARMAPYIQSQAGYEKNTFSMDLPTIERIETACAPAIDAWGYQRPNIADTATTKQTVEAV